MQRCDPSWKSVRQQLPKWQTGAVGRSGAIEINSINPNVQAIIDQQSAIIADLSAKVSFQLSYFGLQDIPDVVASPKESLEGSTVASSDQQSSVGVSSNTVSKNTVKRTFANMVIATNLLSNTRPTDPSVASSASVADGD